MAPLYGIAVFLTASALLALAVYNSSISVDDEMEFLNSIRILLEGME